MGRLFGKDGIRGLAISELTCETAMLIGRATAYVIASGSDKKSKIIVGKDTRSNSDILESAVCAGICSAGVDAEIVGTVPVPACAWLTSSRNASGGIMISASKRIAEYNGIKIFSSEGLRIDDETENEIEKFVLDKPWAMHPEPKKEYGRILRYENAVDDYAEHIKSLSETRLSGLKIAIDCANGSASYTANKIFSGLGAETLIMANRPDGYNINRECGTSYADELMNFVTENGCMCGLAFDGGGERCLAVDEHGDLLDGDELIAVLAKAMKENGTLKNNTFVVTSANNLGLNHFALDNFISTVACSSGDKNITNTLLENNFSLGGDPSGQIILAEGSPVPDGQFVGMRLLEIIKKTDKRLSSLTGLLQKVPQVMMNVPIDRRFSEIWKNDSEITSLIEEFEKTLGEEGRIIVREVGKEPVIRIMAEGKEFTQINAMALAVADKIKSRCTVADTDEEDIQ